VGDSVDTYLGEESFLHVSAAGGAMDSPQLFASKTEFAVRDDHFFAGYTGEFDIRKYDPTGRLLACIRKNHSALPVSDDDVFLLKDRRLDAVRHIEHIRNRVEGFLDAMPLPATMPAFGPMLVDDVGNLWVQQYARPSQEELRWTVFGADGALVAMLETPTRFEPHAIGNDFLLGRWVDENGEEYVRIYPLTKG
jgi:hypothetical protein